MEKLRGYVIHSFLSKTVNAAFWFVERCDLRIAFHVSQSVGCWILDNPHIGLSFSQVRIRRNWKQKANVKGDNMKNVMFVLLLVLAMAHGRIAQGGQKQRDLKRMSSKMSGMKMMKKKSSKYYKGYYRQPDPTKYMRLKITNLSFQQFFSPFFVATHNSKAPPLFVLGSPSSPELARLAEDGKLHEGILTRLCMSTLANFPFWLNKRYARPVGCQVRETFICRHCVRIQWW